MKANELMIGDLLKWKEQPGFNDEDRNTVLRVKNILDDAIKIDGQFELYHISLFEPIPLTPEILEKNGFVIKKKWAQIGNFGNSPLIMWHFVDEPVLKNYKHELEVHQNDTGKVHVRIPCEYVHELQHAFRLCGIEKEIEL